MARLTDFHRQQHPRARRPSRASAPPRELGLQHRHRADAAAPTPAMASRDVHQPVLAPSEPNKTEEIQVGAPC
jgi:hypothetical protein